MLHGAIRAVYGVYVYSNALNPEENAYDVDARGWKLDGALKQSEPGWLSWDRTRYREVRDRSKNGRLMERLTRHGFLTQLQRMAK